MKGIKMHGIIKSRRSTVCFSDKQVSKQILKEIFKAARWAPSSNNQQPWRFIVGINNDNTYKKIVDSLNNGNKIWAADAPVLIVSVAEIVSSYTNMENRYAWHDTGLSLAHLLFQATAMGLYAHPMGGFSPEKITDHFDLPESFVPVSVTALGYLGDVDKLSDNLKVKENRTRSRKNLDDIVFGDNWEKPFQF